MLSGLCQTLISCGAPLDWLTLADLYQEERRCAMYVCMSIDYFESIAPYACMISLQFMQTTWGVFWRQRDFPNALNGYAMADWLLRRGNAFMHQFVTGKDMTSPGLAFNTERLMGGPILPPEFYPSNGGKVPEEHHEISSAMQQVPEPVANKDGSTSAHSGSAFNEGIWNAMLEQKALDDRDRDSLFKESFRNAVFNVEKDDFLFEQSIRNTTIDVEQLT